VLGSSLQKGLRLISSNHDVLEMVHVHKGVPIVELYHVSFVEPTANDGDYEYDDDGGHSRIDQDDPYWDEVYEPDLFDENNDVARLSMEEGDEECEEVENKCEEGSAESEEDVDGLVSMKILVG
jgi:hypothetical protein